MFFFKKTNSKIHIKSQLSLNDINQEYWVEILLPSHKVIDMDDQMCEILEYKKEEIIGKKAKITIRKGQIARLRHVEKDWTVKEGQKVIIENNSSNIQILVDGIALNSAMKGEYLDVLNKSSGKTLKAWVKNNKKVSIFR